MPRLRALTSWSGRRKGEEFDATDMEARVLCARDGFGGQKAELVDRAMRAVEPSDEPQGGDRRRYNRRDMRARS